MYYLDDYGISYSDSDYFKQALRPGGPAKPREPRIPRMPQLYVDIHFQPLALYA